jgi:hypothetical protein
MLEKAKPAVVFDTTALVYHLVDSIAISNRLKPMQGSEHVALMTGAWLVQLNANAWGFCWRYRGIASCC